MFIENSIAHGTHPLSIFPPAACFHLKTSNTSLDCSIICSIRCTWSSLLAHDLAAALAALEARKSSATVCITEISAHPTQGFCYQWARYGTYIPQQISPPSPPPRRFMVIGSAGFYVEEEKVSQAQTSICQVIRWMWGRVMRVLMRTYRLFIDTLRFGVIGGRSELRGWEGLGDFRHSCL